MATLTGCLKKVGEGLHPEDRAAVLDRVRALRAEGKAGPEATRQAVQEQLAKNGEVPTEATRTLFQDNRGAISLGEQQKIITLFKNADPSTLIHEAAHAWVEELLADAAMPDAPQALRDRAAALRKFVGNKEGTLTDEQHELAARAFEAYMMEGKTPSLPFGRVMSRFKSWMTKVYQSIDNLRAPINDEIRNVFDHILATDREIDEARSETGLQPAFKNREEAGMTGAEWRAYLDAVDKSKQAAESKLLEMAMAGIRRQRTAEY